jgi:hypothetical protein
MKYAYSLDEEEYVGPFDSYDDTYSAGSDAIQDDDQTSFWIAEVIDTASRLREDAEHIAEWVVDIVETQMCYFVASDEHMLEFTPDQLKTMGNAIIDAVFANCKVVRFGVENEAKVYVWGDGDD